jgi:hypothetical protein
MGGVAADVYDRLLLEQMGEGKTIEQATAYLRRCKALSGPPLSSSEMRRERVRC